MKTHGGVDVYFRVFLISALVGVVSFTPRPLYSGEESLPYVLDRRLSGPHDRSRRRGEEKILHIPGLELQPLGRPSRTNSLYRLIYTGSHTKQRHVLKSV
jgi:hypothetical protein